MKQIALLILAAILEVGGDAQIRAGLKGGGAVLLVAGSLVLVGYGFLVNTTSLDFSRLMGVYIVVFFAVSQVMAVIFFRERLSTAVLVGGAFILAGGAIMSLWRIAPPA